MTSSERKIVNCLWETKEKTPVRLVAQKANLSSDYARLLCRSLARSGHIKFENDLAHLLKKGRGCFENNDPAADEPMAVAANVTLLTDEPAVASPANDRSDEEENSAPEGRGSLNVIERQEEDASEDNDKDKPASRDEELDKALVDLEPPSKKDESEEKSKPEEPKNETGNESREELKEEKIEEIAEEPKEVLAETEATEEEKMEKPDETELKPEPKAEEKKPVVAEVVVGEAKAENPEKVTLKEEPAKSSGGFGASFKKFINWFAEKK